MKFYEFDEKEKKVDIFNERWYKHPDTGQFFRNVTTILGIIDKGYAFDEWLKQTGYNSEIIIDRAGKFGTEFHKLVELFLHGNKIKYFDLQFEGRMSTELWERFITWINFWKEFTEEHKVEYKPEGIEYIVYNSKYEYAGTIDLIAHVDGELCIFDWKSGSMIGNKESLQSVAYQQALQELGKEVKRGYIVHVPFKKPNKKGYRIHEIENSGELFNLFLATKAVFELENKDQPKILTLPLEVSLEDV